MFHTLCANFRGNNTKSRTCVSQLKCGFFYFSKNLWNARKRKWNALGLLEQSLRLYLERALAQLELLGPPGTREAPLERPPSGPLEQSLRPPGTRVSAHGTPSGSWNRASGSLEQRDSAMEQPSGFWNHQEQPLRLSCPPIGAKEQFR